MCLKIMTDAYAEILPWENILAAFFYVISFYYYWSLAFKVKHSSYEIGPDETKLLLFDYKLCRQGSYSLP